MGFVISAFALPIVLARASVVSRMNHLLKFQSLLEKELTLKFLVNSQIFNGAAYLTLGGNLIIFATIFIFFVSSEQDDGTYGGGF